MLQIPWIHWRDWSYVEPKLFVWNISVAGLQLLIDELALYILYRT